MDDTHIFTGTGSFDTVGIGVTNPISTLNIKETEQKKALVIYGRDSDNLARIDFYRADETCFTGRIQIDNGTTSNMGVRAQGALQLQTGGTNNRLVLSDVGIATFTCQVCAPSAIFTGTSGIKVPTGTSAERPAACTGMVRFNSSCTELEYYNGSEWLFFSSTPSTQGY
jgi:hypothetical protein